MPRDKVKIVLMLAVVFSCMGIYNAGKAAYTAISWTKTMGVISDFQLHNFSCGRQSKCFTLIVAYKVGDQIYRVNSNEKFSDRPLHLEGRDAVVYYSPGNPSQATLGGEYGPLDHGLIGLGFGFLMFIVYWFVRPRG